MSNFDEWNKYYEAMQVRVDEACVKAGHEKVSIIYSAYPYDANDLPADNLDEVFAEGEFQVTVPGDDFFGNGTDYKSNRVTNPTWLVLAIMANESIPVTGDYHHVFLENARIVGPGLIELSFGS